ncbi:NAD(P)-binding protein [Mycena sp. CBHHK59/15]|nr:NAD(P)-binding protein [Mycena sp. CBHHK59/15]
MPSLAVTRASNAQYAAKTRPVLVVFGGTSGIGAGIVQAFARHTHGVVHVVVVGRSKPSADALFASLPQHPESLYEFLPIDCTLMRNVKAASRELSARLTKINYLVLSQGYFHLGDPPTDDGLDPLHALMVYGRVRAALELAPRLQAAAALGEDARIMTVSRAGSGGPINLDDVALQHLSMFKMRGALVTYTDIYTLEIAQRFPDISMTHIYPGFIASGLKRGMPFYLRWIFAVVEHLFATSSENCGEWMMYALVDPTAKTGAHFKTNHAEALGPNKHADEIARAVVWKSLQERSDR